MPDKIVRRLRSYWKLEAGNAVLIPLFGFIVMRGNGGDLSPWVIAAMMACSGLLAIGAACWRMELARVEGDKALAARIIPWLARSRRPAQAGAALGAGAALLEYMNQGGFTPSAIAALVFSVLAVLEFLNYYVVQLQHFDHAPDFKRLITGKGFRRPHLARAIDQYNARK